MCLLGTLYKYQPSQSTTEPCNDNNTILIIIFAQPIRRGQKTRYRIGGKHDTKWGWIVERISIQSVATSNANGVKRRLWLHIFVCGS